MTTSLPLQRYHALDALRATMMLLGLVLHSAVSYTASPLGAAWPYHDPHTSPWFDLIVFFHPSVPDARVLRRGWLLRGTTV